MKKNELKPTYSMPYGTLVQLGDKAESLCERDADILIEYGINEGKRTTLKNKTQELKDMPTDEELLSLSVLLTQEKNDYAEKVKEGIRKIMVRVKNVYGDKSPQYKRFGTKGLDKMSDNDICRCAKRVVRTATEYLDVLADKGLTQEEIAELESNNQVFDDKIDEKDNAVRERDIATENRIHTANELYALICEIFDYGKNHWYSRGEAKYNDYIIYDHASKKDDVKVPAGQRVELNGELTNPETLLEFKNTGSVSLTVFIADNFNAPLPDNALTIESKETMQARCKDISNGTYGILTAYNKNTGDGKISVAEIAE